MGIIRAALNAVGGTFKDQYAELFTCDALDKETLVKRVYPTRGVGSTNRGNDGVISDGSRVVIEPGICMLMIDNGKIIDFCNEPGTYTYNSGTSPSMLTGGMEGLKKSFSTLGERVQFGGQQAVDQRVYAINTKEIMGNKYGIGDVAFRDSEFNFTVKLQCYGEYSYKITDPLMFFTNVSGNVKDTFVRSQIDSQLKAEIQTDIQPALGNIALKRIPYDQLNLYPKDIASELNKQLTEEWVDKRGLSIVSFAVASVKPDDESAKKINQFQESRVYTDATMLGARLGTAQANAMESAAKNSAGAFTGFMGMGMAQSAGGANATQLFNMGQAQGAASQQPISHAAEQASINPTQQEQAPQENQWQCTCGATNTGRFCQECGMPAPKPIPKDSVQWTCSCGAVNSGKFCQECGGKKPFVLDAHCESCGFDGEKPFKFCPECGAENKI